MQFALSQLIQKLDNSSCARLLKRNYAIRVFTRIIQILLSNATISEIPHKADIKYFEQILCRHLCFVYFVWTCRAKSSHLFDLLYNYLKLFQCFQCFSYCWFLNVARSVCRSLGVHVPTKLLIAFYFLLELQLLHVVGYFFLLLYFLNSFII